MKFLRAREIVHYQRFGEGLRLASERLDARNYYAVNPGFDKPAATARTARDMTGECPGGCAAR